MKKYEVFVALIPIKSSLSPDTPIGVLEGFTVKDFVNSCQTGRLG